jgi:hypothetical protein
MIFLERRFLPEWRGGRVESCVVQVDTVVVERDNSRVDSRCTATRGDCRARRVRYAIEGGCKCQERA